MERSNANTDMWTFFFSFSQMRDTPIAILLEFFRRESLLCLQKETERGSSREFDQGLELGMWEVERAVFVAEFHGSIVAKYQSIAILRDGDCLKEDSIRFVCMCLVAGCDMAVSYSSRQT